MPRWTIGQLHLIPTIQRPSPRTIVRIAENLNSLIRRVAYASVDEIDGVILELKRVRDALDSERERLIRDIARYASLNHSLMTAMKIISERLKQWEGTPKSREQAMADFKARWLGGNIDG